MKKILSLLTAITLTSTTASNVIACDSIKKPTNLKNLDLWSSFDKSIFTKYLNKLIQVNLLNDIKKNNPEINNTNNHLLLWSLFNSKYLVTYIENALSKMSQANITTNDFTYYINHDASKTSNTLPSGYFYKNYAYNNTYTFWTGEIYIHIVGKNQLKGSNTIIDKMNYKPFNKYHTFNDDNIYASTTINNKYFLTYVKTNDVKTGEQYLTSGLYISDNLNNFTPFSLSWGFAKYGNIEHMQSISKNRIIVYTSGGIDKQIQNAYIIALKDGKYTLITTPLLGTANITVNDIKLFGNYILIATSTGLYFGNTNNNNLTLKKITSTATQNVYKLYYDAKNKKTYYSVKDTSNLYFFNNDLTVKSQYSKFQCNYDSTKNLSDILAVYFMNNSSTSKIYIGTKKGAYVSDGAITASSANFKNITTIPTEAWCIGNILKDQKNRIIIPTMNGIYYKEATSNDFQLIINSDKIDDINELISFSFNNINKEMVLTQKNGLWDIDQLKNFNKI